MAYVERWWTDWKPLGQSVTYTVRIKEDGYAGGTTAIETLAKEPLSVRNRGNKEFSVGAVIGTEIEFTFKILPSDGTDYDDLLTADATKYLVEVERDSVLYFIGYMKPENVSKALFGRYFTMKISASDNLANLKNLKFKDAATNDSYTDRVNFLATIKRCLDYTGLAIDINVKLGTFESSASLMTSIECALDKANTNSLRWYKEREGILKPESCHAVLSQQIGIFNCSIRQLNGEWYIFNNVEVNSFLFNFDWATLTQQSRTAHNPIVNIDAYDFKSRGSQMFRPPLSSFATTFQNKYVPDNLISNGDFSNGLTGWTNGSAPNDFSSFTESSEILRANDSALLADDKWFTSAVFAVTQVASTDLMVLSLRAYVNDITYSDPVEGEPPSFRALITNTTTADSIYVNLGQLSEEWAVFTPVSHPEILGTGDYTVRIIMEQDNNITSIQVRIDDIHFYIDYGAAAVTVDKVITITNDNAVDILEEKYTTRIGDAPELNDQGSIRIGATLTSSWSTYGLTEDVPIVDLLGAFQLNARQSFTKFLRLVISDPSDNIDSGTIIVFDGKNYRIIRYKKIFKNITVDVDVLEINS